MPKNSRFQTNIKEKHEINSIEREMKEVRTHLILAAKEKKKKQDMEQKMLGVKKKLSLKQLSSIANWDLNDESQNIDPFKADKKRGEAGTPSALRKNIANGDTTR